jgi:hypothetical protein
VAGTEAARLSILSVFRVVARNPALRRTELAFVTFNCGEFGSWVAMLVYAYTRGGVTESGVVATVMLVPAALLAPPLAALAERRAPGRALLAAYMAQAISSLAVAAALYAGAPSLWVYALMAFPAVAFAATRPTQAAFTPGLATVAAELTATNVVSGWIESASILVAPASTGLLLAVGSPGLVFLLAGLGCAGGAALIFSLRNAVPRPAAAEEGGVDTEGESLSVLRHDVKARQLIVLLTAQSVAIGALDVLNVELAQGVLHRGANWAGYLGGAFGAGGVLAVVVTARLVGRRRLVMPLVLSVAAWSAAFVGVAAVPGVIAALVFLAVGGGAQASFDVTGRTLLQRTARPGLLARVFGLLEGMHMVGLGIGSALAPVLVTLGGAPFAYVAVGAVLPVVALGLGKRLLEIDRHADVPVVEIALLRSMSLFAALPPPTLESIARALVPVAAPAGTVVINEGEEGDRFYAIASGELDITSAGRHVATRVRGDGVGEIALLHGVPRTAAVTARADSQLYALDREDFLVALTGHSSVRLAADDLVEARLEELRRLDSSPKEA